MLSAGWFLGLGCFLDSSSYNNTGGTTTTTTTTTTTSTGGSTTTTTSTGGSTTTTGGVGGMATTTTVGGGGMATTTTVGGGGVGGATTTTTTGGGGVGGATTTTTTTTGGTGGMMMCDGGPCPKDKGEPCADVAECKTGLFCVDGVCCGGDCAGTCRECNGVHGGVAGTCFLLPAGTDFENDCNGVSPLDFCNGGGSCGLGESGYKCVGASGICKTGDCTNGVCP